VHRATWELSFGVTDLIHQLCQCWRVRRRAIGLVGPTGVADGGVEVGPRRRTRKISTFSAGW